VLGEFELCFSWSFLYKCRDELEDGSLFYQMLRNMIKAYTRLSWWNKDRLAALQSLYRPLKETIFDFVYLMNIPYVQTLQCKCPEAGQHLIADGVMVSCKRDALRLYGNWLPAQAEGDQAPERAMFGSHKESRFLVRDWCSRETLRKLASSRSGEGADEVVPIASREWCDIQYEALGKLMLPAEEGGVVQSSGSSFHVFDWAKGFCYEIGAHSPAVALVNIGCVPGLLRWTAEVQSRLEASGGDAQSQWRSDDIEQAKVALKPIYPFLKTVHNAASQAEWQLICACAHQLVEDLVKVRLLLCSSLDSVSVSQCQSIMITSHDSVCTKYGRKIRCHVTSDSLAMMFSRCNLVLCTVPHQVGVVHMHAGCIRCFKLSGVFC
jgi:hypothetical protein